MKKIKLLFLSALLCLAAFGLVACGDPSLNTEHSMSINRNEIVMDAGDVFHLVAVCGDSEVTFETDDSAVATVDANGKITAVGEGETFITATAEGESRSCKVSVFAPEYEIVFDKAENITLAQNAVVEIKATLLRDGVEKQTTFSWSVTNKAGCSLQADGDTVRFTSATAGEYVIKATCDKAVGSVTVTVLSV